MQLIRDGQGRLAARWCLITDTRRYRRRAAARKALAAGVRVSVLGVGTAQGGPVPLAGRWLPARCAMAIMTLARRDDAALAALAAAGGGRYVADDRRSDATSTHCAPSCVPAPTTHGQRSARRRNGRTADRGCCCRCC